MSPVGGSVSSLAGVNVRSMSPGLMLPEKGVESGQPVSAQQATPERDKKLEKMGASEGHFILMPVDIICTLACVPIGFQTCKVCKVVMTL